MKMNHYLNVPGLLRRFAKIGLALLLVLSVAFGAGAQDVSPARVSGTVVDQQGMPIVGAGVVVRGTQTGSVTDLDGRFTVMAAKDATLTVSFIGYTTREVPVGTQTDIRIVLAENVQSIDDVVVVGFGTQKKETVTGAIGQLSGKELMRSPVTNISNALVGRIAGMAAVQKTGEAGFEESTIRVRGVGTYAGDQNPQFVLRKDLNVVGLAVVGERLVAQHGIVVGIDQAGQGRRGGEADIGRERDFQAAFAAALGRHDDDAVGTAYAVHGCRRSVLEHVDVLHIVRVEHVEGRHVAHDAVDDDQRILVDRKSVV